MELGFEHRQSPVNQRLVASADVAFQSYEKIQTFNENLVWTSAPTIYQLVLAPSRSSGRKESSDVAIWCSSHR